MQAGNKIKLNFYFKYGTWFYGVNTKSSYGTYVFLINTFYVKVYKNSTLINTYTYNINGNYSNTVNAYSTIDVKTWLNVNKDKNSLKQDNITIDIFLSNKELYIEFFLQGWWKHYDGIFENYKKL